MARQPTAVLFHGRWRAEVSEKKKKSTTLLSLEKKELNHA
jgi:hypothetical protein